MATIADMEQDLISMERKLPWIIKQAIGKSGEKLVQELKTVAPKDTGHLASQIRYETKGKNKGTISSNAYKDGFNYAIMHEKLMWENYYNPITRTHEGPKRYQSSSPYYFSRTIDAFIRNNTLKKIIDKKLRGLGKILGFND